MFFPSRKVLFKNSEKASWLSFRGSGRDTRARDNLELLISSKAEHVIRQIHDMRQPIRSSPNVGLY